MRKKKTKAQQEHDKQLRRLKSIVRRAEKAGLVFDSSPIPENATTKRLSKITGVDIRKQGYRLTSEGEKDYYTPYKERQRGVQKAKETIAKKREQPSYNYMYIAQREYASKVAQKRRKASPPTDSDIQTARLHYEFAKTRHQDKLKNIQQYVEEVHQGKVDTEVYTPAFLEESADAYVEGRNSTYYDDYYYESVPESFNPNDYSYKYAFAKGEDTPYWADTREEFNEGIKQKLADSDYEQFHGVVFDTLTEEPVARFDQKTSSFIPFEFQQNEFYGNPKTGEVYGTYVDMFSFEILDKLESGIYTAQGEYILNEHGEPIATIEQVKNITDSAQRHDRFGAILVPYETPTFKDIADYNLDDYISGFSPNMESTLRELYEEIIEDEDDFVEVQENLQNVHYAYEQVMNYSSYEELLTGYFEMAKALKGGEELTDEEMKQLEQAVNDDRVKRTRRKKKRKKKK